MRFYGKKRAVRGRRNYRKRRSVPRKGRKTIAKVVKKVLASTLERKAWFFSSANISLTTAHSTRAPVALNLIPGLVQGTGHSQRIGNEVKVSRAYVKGYVNLRAYDATANPGYLPVMVKFYLSSYKINNQPDITVSTTFNTFFESNNSAVGFQGNILDCILTSNKDAWTVHSTKTVKLGASSIYTNGTLIANGYYDNSPMIAPFYFDYTKHISKIKFDDTVNNLCTNRNLYLFFQVIQADGSSSTGAITPAELHSSIRVEYTDA